MLPVMALPAPPEVVRLAAPASVHVDGVCPVISYRPGTMLVPPVMLTTLPTSAELAVYPDVNVRVLLLAPVVVQVIVLLLMTTWAEF
jgi:hypothetical protein